MAGRRNSEISILSMLLYIVIFCLVLRFVVYVSVVIALVITIKAVQRYL